MARAAKKDEFEGEVPQKDFDHAVKIYRQDIKPAVTKVGEYNQEASSGYKAIKKECHLQISAAKTAFKLHETEEAKAADWLRCFVGTYNQLVGHEALSFNDTDLVDMAENGRSRPNLVPVGDED